MDIHTVSTYTICCVWVFTSLNFLQKTAKELQKDGVFGMKIGVHIAVYFYMH